MTTINLKDFYYWYTQDQFIEVSDEVAEVFVSDARHEMAYQRRLSRHKAQYSLDCDDGIEYSACLHEPTPQELLERMELFIRLWNALNSLPEIQGRRIDAHIILGKSIPMLLKMSNSFSQCLCTQSSMNGWRLLFCSLYSIRYIWLFPTRKSSRRSIPLQSKKASLTDWTI